MYSITSEQMQKLEQNCVQCGINEARLMQNAGEAAAELINKLIPVKGKRCMVFCGKGGNGGDGFVAAAKLVEKGAQVAIVLVDGVPPKEYIKEKLVNAAGAGAMALELARDLATITEMLQTVDIVVDAIYGTGFRGEMQKPALRAAGLINSAIAAVFALDLPSGIYSDEENGDIGAVKADFTIAFEYLKPAHIFKITAEQCGKIHTVPIGIPEDLKKDLKFKYAKIDDELAKEIIKPYPKDAHKGKNGQLLCIVGSEVYPGAAMLCLLGALRSGAGIVKLAAVPYVSQLAALKYNEVVHLPLAATAEGQVAKSSLPKLLEAAKNADAVLIGPGLGNSAETVELVKELLLNIKVPILLDADGINALAANIDIISSISAELIITPHPGELARLAQMPVAEVINNHYKIAKMFVEKFPNVTLVAKNHSTFVVPAGGGIYIAAAGNAGLAKGGSGDLLAGITASLLAQKITPELAAAAGVHLHGRAADICAEKFSQHYMQPSDVAECLKDVLKLYGR